jgi:Kef-type K+ transport system membrane component KefB
VSERLKFVRNLAIVALIALAFTAAPGGDSSLAFILTLLTILFFAAIAFLGYRLYREYNFTLESLDQRSRLVLYGSIGLAFFAFAATARLFDAGLAGAMGWLALLGLASYGVFWVYQRSQRYD